MRPHLLWIFPSLLCLVQACAEHGVQPSSAEEILSQLRKRTTSTIEKTAIHNVRVFQHDHFTPPTTVILEDGYVTTCAKDIKVSIDGSGKFIIPGLIDSHVHISSVDGLANFTSYGATTALSMNCGNYEGCKALRNQPGLASFLTAGLSIVGADSHHAEILNRTSDGVVYPNTTETQLMEMVSSTFGNGSDWVKITAEENGPSEKQQTVLVEDTHRAFNKQTMTHAARLTAYQQAVSSKTDGIQHVPDDGVISWSLVDEIKANGQFVTPTMNIFNYGVEYPEIGAFIQLTANESYTYVVENVQRLHKAGIPILAGTDAVGYMAPGMSVPFGLTVHYELGNLVQAGLTPAEALRAGTSEAAKWHRLHDRGSVTPGLQADIVMLNSNPLLNISNTQDIARIWVRGVEVQKAV